MWGRLLRLAVAAAAVVGTWAHGYITSPVARNYKSGTWCDHCQNAGGVIKVYGPNVKEKWPHSTNFGVCGDETTGDKAFYHEGGGTFEKTVGYRISSFRAGDVMTVRGILTANHFGYMSYFLCVLPANVQGGIAERKFLTNACFAKIPLKVQFNGAWGDRFYVDGQLSTFTNNVRLPDMPCPRCVLRWYYLTANSCRPPGVPAPFFTPGVDTQPCGGPSSPPPEEFWNCADIRIVKKGDPLPAVTQSFPKGEVASAVAAPTNSTTIDTSTTSVDVMPPEEQVIEYSDDDAAPATGDDGDGHNPLISFQDVAISVVVGTGLGIPVVIISPIIGTAVGLSAFILVLVFFMFRRNKEAYQCMHKQHYF